MANVFEDLMAGLEEVDAFLAGETAGYKVNLPAKSRKLAVQQHLQEEKKRISPESD